MSVNPWLDRQEYPFQSCYLPLEMGRLHYVDEGTGPTLLLTHGNPTWALLYRDTVAAIIEQMRRHLRLPAGS